jgi:hypothetical protein
MPRRASSREREQQAVPGVGDATAAVSDDHGQAHHSAGNAAYERHAQRGPYDRLGPHGLCPRRL